MNKDIHPPTFARQQRRFPAFPWSGLAVAASLALAACGGGGGSDGGGGGNTAPVANAGADALATQAAVHVLDGGASVDADGDGLVYTWRQTMGPDVTNGTGTLGGQTPSFNSPGEVCTLEFALVVFDGKADSVADTVRIHVVEDKDAAIFVDADAGSDATGTGRMDQPYATLRFALGKVSGTGTARHDIYLRSRAAGAAYDESASALSVPEGTSLYGGYGADWLRDAPGNRTEVQTNSAGVAYGTLSTDTRITVSGLSVTAANSSNPGAQVMALFADGPGFVQVEDSRFVAGNVSTGTAAQAGTSYAVFLSRAKEATVRNNVLVAGNGGNGSSGAVGADGAPGHNGSAGNRTADRRAAGGSGGDGANGGSGGERGGGPGGDGGAGAAGGSIPAPQGGTISGGTAGRAGAGGVVTTDGGIGKTGGEGVPGAPGVGNGQFGTAFLGHAGAAGGTGGGGSGGGGGGGGEANNVGVVGGGGGGGGEGGYGGQGGIGGNGGGASIGLWLRAITTASITGNTITSRNGGHGALGGLGGAGGQGGSGGNGVVGDSNAFGSGGEGGDGGDGGFGGRGGHGGGGGGGPSYGIVIGSGMAPRITGNTITTGNGGNGGPGGFHGLGGGGGYSFGLFDANTGDGRLPIQSDNTFTIGSSGLGGIAGGGTAGTPGATGQRNW